MWRWVSFLLALCLAGGLACSILDSRSRSCSLCGRPLHAKTYPEIDSRDGRTHQVCCPRCVLHDQASRTDPSASRVADYYSKKLIGAEEAFFVENSSFHPCSSHDSKRDSSGTAYAVSWDRCMPSLVAFASLEAAKRFRREKGGVIKSYQALLRASQ